MNAQCPSTFSVFWHTSSNSSQSASWRFCPSFKFCTFSPNVWHSNTCYMIAHASMLGIQSLSSCTVYRTVFCLFLCLTQFTDEVSFSDNCWESFPSMTWASLSENSVVWAVRLSFEACVKCTSLSFDLLTFHLFLLQSYSTFSRMKEYGNHI